MVADQTQDDPVVSPVGANEMYQALKAAGVPAQLMTLPGERHSTDMFVEAWPGTIDYWSGS